MLQREQSIEALDRRFISDAPPGGRAPSTVFWAIGEQCAASVCIGYALEVLVGKLAAPFDIDARGGTVDGIWNKTECDAGKKVSQSLTRTGVPGQTGKRFQVLGAVRIQPKFPGAGVDLHRVLLKLGEIRRHRIRDRQNRTQAVAARATAAWALF
jgi:hypothetical protein